MGTAAQVQIAQITLLASHAHINGVAGAKVIVVGFLQAAMAIFPESSIATPPISVKNAILAAYCRIWRVNLTAEHPPHAIVLV